MNFLLKLLNLLNLLNLLKILNQYLKKFQKYIINNILTILNILNILNISTILTILITQAAQASQPAQINAPDLPAGITQQASVEGITQYQLNNGLTILLLPDETKPTITVNMTYRVGSKHENYGETGMAHLLEHLMFKGTTSIPNLNEAMNRRGFKMNGTTYFDRTNYYETFNADLAYLDWAIGMEADRMVNSLIAKHDLETEMNVVWDELRRGENNPERILSQRMMSVAFDWHNYGKATIGATSDLEHVSIEHLQAFYKLYYQPDNAVLTVAGRIDTTTTLKRIQAAFQSIPKPTRVLPNLYTVEPTQDGERRVTLRRVGNGRLLAAQYHVPAASHADHAPLSVLVHILGNEPAGRLYQALEQRGLAAQSYAWQNALAQRSVLVVGVQLDEAEDKHHLHAAETALLQATEAIGTVSPAELKRAQHDLAADFNQLLKSPEALAIALSESIGQGDWRLLFVQREAIKAVTVADIERVATAYLKPDNRTIGLVLPTAHPNRAEIPVAPDAKVVADMAHYAPPTTIGERFDPTPTALENRTIRGYLPATSIAYINLSKHNRADAVTLQIQLRWGTEAIFNQQGAKQLAAANWVALMLLEGSQGLSKQQLADELAKLQSTLTIQGQTTGATIKITSDVGHIASVVALLEPLLKKPLFEEAALERLRSNQLATLQGNLQQPDAIIADVLAKRANLDQHLTPNDWRYHHTTLEQIDALHHVTVPEIKQFYQNFWSTSHASVSTIGVVPEHLPAILSKVLHGWGASPMAVGLAYERPNNAYQPNQVFETQVPVNDSRNAVIALQGAFQLKRTDPDYWLLQIGSTILGGDPFNSRIGKRVRVQEGLSYSAGSYINVDVYDDHAVYAAYASFAPNNLYKVRTALREELARLLKDGITEAELKHTQDYLLQNLMQQRASDAYLANHVLYQTEQGLTFAVHTEHQHRIEAATVASVNRALRQYLGKLNFVTVSAGDF